MDYTFFVGTVNAQNNGRLWINCQADRRPEGVTQDARDRRFADRIKAIVLLGNGWSVSEVAQALLIDEKTVRNWCDIYQQGGTDALFTLHYEGKAASLSDQQQKELVKHLDKNTYLTSNAIRAYVKKKYGVKYSATGMKDLLHRLGFSHKKPKHIRANLIPKNRRRGLPSIANS